jgi:hypothetical protein
MEYYYLWFFIFAFLAYFIVTDVSVAKGFYLTIQILKSKYEITKWWLMNNPSNPVIKYMIWRRSMKIARELEREINDKRK